MSDAFEQLVQQPQQYEGVPTYPTTPINPRMKWREIIEDARGKRGTWRLLQPLVVYVAAGMRHADDYGSSPVFKSEWVKTALPPGTLISDQFHTWIAMRDDGESQFISMTDPDRDPHAHTRNPPLDQMERVATPRTLPIPKPIREGTPKTHTVMEGRDAYLYHGTELVNAVAIVRDNMIDGYTEREHLPFAVSTTRDPRLAFDVGTWWDRTHPVVFVLDQRKLAQTRKIVPHVDVDSDGEVWGYDREKSPTRQRGNESEERVIGSIKPLDRYLVSINVDPSFLARARRDGTAAYAVHEKGHFKTSKEFLAALDAFSRHPKLNALPLPHGVAKMNAEYRKQHRYRGAARQPTGPLSPPVVPSRKRRLP